MAQQQQMHSDSLKLHHTKLMNPWHSCLDSKRIAINCGCWHGFSCIDAKDYAAEKIMSQHWISRCKPSRNDRQPDTFLQLSYRKNKVCLSKKATIPRKGSYHYHISHIRGLRHNISATPCSLRLSAPECASSAHRLSPPSGSEKGTRAIWELLLKD